MKKKPIRVVLVEHYLSLQGMNFLKLNEPAPARVTQNEIENLEAHTLIEKFGWTQAARILIQRHEKTLPKDKRGFISLQLEQDAKDKELLKVDLRFKDEESLQAWLNYPPHEVLIEALEPYRTRPWHWTVFDLDEKTPLSSVVIKWETEEISL